MERDEAMPCVPDLTKKRTSERERERESLMMGSWSDMYKGSHCPCIIDVLHLFLLAPHFISYDQMQRRLDR